MSLERTVIDNIKRIRKEQNISQEKLAEECGTSTSYIGLMETYKNIPKLSTIEKIADALNVAPIELFKEISANENNIEQKQKLREKIKNELMKGIEEKIDLALKRI